jgi:thiol:disulfide interchange protein DsbD
MSLTPASPVRKSSLPRILFWILTLGLFLGSPLSSANLFGLGEPDQPEFLPVERAFPLETHIESTDKGPRLLASWQSEPGYYLYQHRIYLSQSGEKYLPISFSQTGIEKQDEAFGLVNAFYGELTAIFDLSQLQPGEATLNHQGCADAGLCYPPQRLTLTLTERETLQSPEGTGQAEKASDHSNNRFFDNRSALATIGLFFLFGLGLTFTPCVLPMVPILTSVVLGRGQSDTPISGKRGFLLSSTYVLGMAVTYATAGLVVGLLGAGANIQAWMQTPWVLIAFALLFVALALSMFGLYELQLPRAIRDRLNHANQNQSGGNWLGVLIMGVLSALVVSPCVSAPLAGALVYLSTTGDALLGGLALLALGLGMGTPLIALGTTGASVLPKAGGWMDAIKVLFGVLLLGVAIWMLERILPGHVTLLLWGLLAVMYAIQLGALEPASRASQRITKGIGWVLLLYGAAALWGSWQGNANPLQPLASTHSGLPADTQHQEAPFYRTDSVEEIERQISQSQQPVMLDLYADWCISCKVMDREVFSDAEVQGQLSEHRWLQLDLTDQTEEQIDFLTSNALFGPPTVLFYRDGKELVSSRLVGEASREAFLRHISQL